MEITLHYIEGARFSSEAGKHRVVVDQPAEDGATDQGMTPAEMLLTALGSCVGQHVAQYLKLRSLPSQGLRIRVGAERSTRPLQLDDFRVEIVAPGLTERQLRALEKTLPSGLVQNAVIRTNSIRISAGNGSSDETRQ